MQTPGSDVTMESEMLMDESIPETKGDTLNFRFFPRISAQLKLVTLKFHSNTYGATLIWFLKSDSGKKTGTSSCHHTFIYGHGALYRRLSVINVVSSSAKVCVHLSIGS